MFDLFNPAVTSGVDLFINITIFLIASVHALFLVNARKEKNKSVESKD
jgi:outer membrane protein W